MVDGPNLYAYVLNDPINFTDPSGLYITQIGNGVYSCTRPGVISIDGEEPRFGGVRCTFLYSVAEEPDTSTNPGGGFRGSGGRGQVPPGMMEEMMAVAQLCAQINDAANRTRSNLPTNPNARTVEGLRYERAVAQLDLQVIGPLAGLFGLAGVGGGLASAVPVRGTSSVGFARVSFVVGTVAAAGLASLVARDTARIAAIDARINQLNAQTAGLCQ